MASLVYNRFAFRLLNGDFDPSTAVVRALLTTSAYTPNNDHNTLNDVTNELSTGSYGRQTITNLTVTEDDAGDQGVLDGDNPQFSGVGDGTETAAWCVLFERLAGADATTDPLIAALDITDTLTSGLTLVVRIPATGILTATT